MVNKQDDHELVAVPPTQLQSLAVITIAKPPSRGGSHHEPFLRYHSTKRRSRVEDHKSIKDFLEKLISENTIHEEVSFLVNRRAHLFQGKGMFIHRLMLRSLLFVKYS
ncbi:hypothetical protein TNIN_371511 [Trichonephila inaurata madagascariensis]|uniref:Uncharacterized protein n=1 Tax=Trichonephila inaurata madagascariensis TaxID=2747483 RepID=A0A8X6X8B7_9ARAC|nr:hypothetical protein TNIN_371511 [Trichonephila inaurata madagascariensis]